MSPELPNQEQLSTPEQASRLFDFLKSRLGDQPTGESKFYRLDDERFALVYLFDTTPNTCYGISTHSKNYLKGPPSSERFTYYISSDAIDKYIDVQDPQCPDEWDQEEVKPSEDEVANLIKDFEQDIEVPREVFVAEMEAMEKEHQNKTLRKEIIMGADRPLIGYLDERREIHLADNVELSIPLEKPTLQVECQSCEEQLVVFYELSTPDRVECPACGHENNLVRCINCNAERQPGDQGFIELDVPYGSTVHDSFFDGPAYACSAKCLVEAFSKDDFEAKGMFADMIVEPVERSFEPVADLMTSFFNSVKKGLGEGSAESVQLDSLVRQSIERLPKDTQITDEDLTSAFDEPFSLLAEMIEKHGEALRNQTFGEYIHMMKKLNLDDESSPGSI